MTDESGPTGGEVKSGSLGFTFAKKKVVQKVAVNVEEKKDSGQLITGFDGAKAQVVGGDEANVKTSYVVPKLENTFQAGVGPKKFVPTFKPPSNDDAKLAPGEDKFVQAASTGPVITEYGLQLRDAKPEDHGADAGGSSSLAQVLEERAYKEAMEQLPDVADEEAYEAMPVEEFGRAMLRGMGWQEGMGVGRNRKKVDAIEYVRRPERLGLGAQPVKLPDAPNKVVKMGDKPRRQDLVLAPDADGRQRNIRKLDEQLVERSKIQSGPAPGKVMRLLAGPHSGLLCAVLEMRGKGPQGTERVLVRLAASQQDVEVDASELGEKGEQQGQQKGGGREREEGSRRGGDRDGDRGDDGRGRGRGRSAEEDGERARGRERNGDRGADRRGGRGGDDDDLPDRERDRDRGRERDGRDDGAGGSKRRHRDEDFDDRGAKKKHHTEDRERRDRDDREDDERRGGSKHKHKDKHKHKEKDKDRDREKDKERRRDKGRRGGSSSEEDEDDRAEERRPPGPTWLFPNIKVRIVDKRVRGGKLYLRKGVVLDVHPGATADVAVDETGDVLRLPESSLETVVPKHEGAAVLVVGGPHRGARGRLLQCNTAAGAAAVQLAADFSIQRLLLDHVAAYVGEMEED